MSQSPDIKGICDRIATLANSAKHCLKSTTISSSDWSTAVLLRSRFRSVRLTDQCFDLIDFFDDIFLYFMSYIKTYEKLLLLSNRTLIQSLVFIVKPELRSIYSGYDLPKLISITFVIIGRSDGRLSQRLFADRL